MSIQLGYSAQLAFSITENTTTTPIFRTSPFTLPTWLQLALLSTACIASMLFMSSNIFKKQKTVTSRYTWEHALFAILGASTSAACGILTVFNYILHGHSGIILTTFSTIIWVFILFIFRRVCIGRVTNRSPDHRYNIEALIPGPPFPSLNTPWSRQCFLPGNFFLSNSSGISLPSHSCRLPISKL